MRVRHIGGRGVAAMACAVLVASCVNKEKYDDTHDLAKSYQTDLHDTEAEIARLRAENKRLNAELRGGAISGLQSSSGDSDWEARVGHLQGLIDNLGRDAEDIEDIERFDVDGGYVYMIQDKVLFDSGSAEIGADGEAALLDLATAIQAAPHGRIFVRGHTDSDPVSKPETKRRFPHGNLQLSAERAVAVGSLITTRGGIDGADVVVVGFGHWEAVAPNDSADNKRLNRRVEIFVTDASK